MPSPAGGARVVPTRCKHRHRVHDVALIVVLALGFALLRDSVFLGDSVELLLRVVWLRSHLVPSTACSRCGRRTSTPLEELGFDVSHPECEEDVNIVDSKGAGENKASDRHMFVDVERIRLTREVRLHDLVFELSALIHRVADGKLSARLTLALVSATYTSSSSSSRRPLPWTSPPASTPPSASNEPSSSSAATFFLRFLTSPRFSFSRSRPWPFSRNRRSASRSAMVALKEERRVEIVLQTTGRRHSHGSA